MYNIGIYYDVFTVSVYFDVLNVFSANKDICPFMSKAIQEHNTTMYHN